MTIVKELDALHVNWEEYKFPANEWDMKYSDFSLVTKSGATITLDLFSEIEPSANFTVNAPSEIKEGQMYILRVTTWATPYTMTLWTWITNPYNESTTLTANTVHQFGFLAVDWALELQPSVTQSWWWTWWTITWTLSDQTDLQTALNAKADASDLNTKTFILSSTSDLTNAQAAYDWYAAGKNPIIMYNRTAYIVTPNDWFPQALNFSPASLYTNRDSSKTMSWILSLQIFHSWDTVTSIQTGAAGINILETDRNYSTPYTPKYNWSPATKKYVDDSVKTYTAWTWLTLSGTEFSADTTVLATKTDLANIWSYKVVATLPSAETADTKKIYLLWPIGTGADKYEEWIVVDNAWWECEWQLNEIPLVLGNSNTTAYVEVWDPVLSELKETRWHTIYMWINYTTSTSSYNKTRFNFWPHFYYYWTNYNDVPHIQTQSMGQYDGFSWWVNWNMRIGTSKSTNKLVDYSMVWSFSQITYRTKAWTKIWETSIDLSWYATTTALTNWLASKQDTLVSGTNIKTINNESLLWSGNITISAPTYTAWEWIDITDNEISVDTDVIQEKLTAWEGISITGWTVCITESDRKWPAPSGFHVPSQADWAELNDVMVALNLTTWNSWRINLHMPFAGRRNYSSADLDVQGTHGNYWSSSPYGSDNPGNASYIRLSSSYVDTGNTRRALGFSVRYFKNSYVVPDSTWTVIQWTLGSVWIFHNATLWLISAGDGTHWITMSDKNLWATTVYNDWDTLTQANMGNMYQWWNNYWFPSTWTISNTSSTQVDASWYGPNTANWYYGSDTFITWSSDWSSVHNDDLWWDTSNSTHQECTTGWPLTISADTTVLATKTDLSWKQDKATSWSTAPLTTPTYVGQQYVDTTNDKIYVATGTTSSSDWTEVWAWSWDMLYQDFNWVTKTWATVTLDINSTITPSANFTVNAPSTIKDWQIYILRVVNWATAYTMTLGTWITNPYNTSTTLTANFTDQFVFQAIGWSLELLPDTEIAISWNVAPAITPAHIWQQYINTSTNIPYIATWVSNSSDWQTIPILSKQTWAATNIKFWIWTTTAYENLGSYDNNTVYICKKVVS